MFDILYVLLRCIDIKLLLVNSALVYVFLYTSRASRFVLEKRYHALFQ